MARKKVAQLDRDIAQALARRRSKKRKAHGDYFVVQIDDDGSRRLEGGFGTAREAAGAVASVVPWIDVDAFATSGFANSPEGGERFEIGVEE